MQYSAGVAGVSHRLLDRPLGLEEKRQETEHKGARSAAFAE